MKSDDGKVIEFVVGLGSLAEANFWVALQIRYSSRYA